MLSHPGALAVNADEIKGDAGVCNSMRGFSSLVATIRALTSWSRPPPPPPPGSLTSPAAAAAAPPMRSKPSDAGIPRPSEWLKDHSGPGPAARFAAAAASAVAQGEREGVRWAVLEAADQEKLMNMSYTLRYALRPCDWDGVKLRCRGWAADGADIPFPPVRDDVAYAGRDTFDVIELVPAVKQGLYGMYVGERRLLWLDADAAYGQSVGPVAYEVTLEDVVDGSQFARKKESLTPDFSGRKNTWTALVVVMLAVLSYWNYLDATYGGPLNGKKLCITSPLPSFAVKGKLDPQCAPIWQDYLEPMLPVETQKQVRSFFEKVARPPTCGPGKVSKTGYTCEEPDGPASKPSSEVNAVVSTAASLPDSA